MHVDKRHVEVERRYYSVPYRLIGKTVHLRLTRHTVEVFYLGFLSSDGTVFDESYSSGSAFPVTIGQTSVIEGWTQALTGVQLGGRYQFDIPAELAYGDRGAPPKIRPGATLVFEVELLEILK